ncbi:hypothetical protein FB451DRAFT_1563789 [Mycena latifolia]|nr:hypothetical protein FB451DRAFT_1563789 [Mycena latifolia]
MADVQAHTARLIALFVNCVLYGILLTTFIPCIRSLLFSASQKFQIEPRREIKFPILVATTFMFFVSTFSAVLSLQNVIDAFINYPGGALEFYNTVNAGWTHWMLGVEDAVQVIVGDALLIYRCYVIHDRNWRTIAVPGVCWMAMTALTTTFAYENATTGSRRLDVPILSAALLLTFATSVSTTYLIVRRLFTVGSRPELRGALQPHFLTRVGVIFFETGLIYTVSVIATLAVYLSNSNLEYVVAGSAIHIIPLTWNLLLIRVEGIDRSPKESGTTGRSLGGAANDSPKAAAEV